MNPRLQHSSDIEYIILLDEYQTQLPFLIPNNLNGKTLDIIKFLPKNFYQIFDYSVYLQILFNSNETFPYKITFIKRSDVEYLLSYISSRRNYLSIILDKKKDLDIKEKIENDKKLKLDFIHFIDLIENNIEEEITQFFKKIDNEKSKIFEKFKINIDKDAKINFDNDFNDEFDYFLPNKNNFLNIKNHLGEFSVFLIGKEEKIKETSLKAIKNPNSEERLNSQLSLIQETDELYYKFNQPSKYLAYNFELQPIVITAPFNNPDLLDFFLNADKLLKSRLNSIRIEQTKNFVSTLVINDGENEYEKRAIYESGQLYNKEKLNFLDSISFLHSSFKFNPYLRLPMIGKSVYKELSFLNPSQFNKFKTQKAQYKISDTITKIGQTLAENLLSRDLKKYLQKRNSQLIIISDLPIEWINIDSVFISFTHDITRLPETTYNNLLSSFVINQNIDFCIDENIINDTLVIIGNDEPEFNKWSPLINELSEKNNFNFEICLTIEQFINALNKHNPKFLIIDTHGDYDELSKETFLWIGQEKLTNEVILENKISIPLVYISACGTAPIYGTYKPIANSFLENGSKSVTSTFLPIEINSSTAIYLTILNNLNSVAEKGSFHNWLEYICYNIRSSFIHRIFLPYIDEKVQIDENLYHTLIQDVLFFEKRKEIFKELMEIMKLQNNRVSKIKKQQAFEFLYYTNIGRGDLVLFKTYKEKNGKINYS